MRYGIHPHTVFASVNKIADLKIRAFAWKYFQGALNFNHKATCDCGRATNTHQHIFFECELTQFLRDQADRFADLIYTHKPVKYSIPWNETFFWSEWGTYDPRPPLIRCIMICALQAMWSSIGTRFRVPITKNLQNMANAQLMLARNIRKDSEREKRVCQVERQWKFDKLWLTQSGFPTLKLFTIKSIEGTSKLSNTKLPLI